MRSQTSCDATPRLSLFAAAGADGGACGSKDFLPRWLGNDGTPALNANVPEGTMLL